MAHQSEVKLYLEASSKDELIQKQVDNNNFHSMGFVYDSPIKEGSKWVVWFTANVMAYARTEANRPKPVVPKAKTKKSK